MNVTQLIPNYLGGVSRKPDFDKQPGEVNDAINAYPDETYGLIKRIGTEFIGSSTTSPGGNWKDWCFFSIIREGRPPYLLGIHEGYMKIWNMTTGVECSINNTLPDFGYFGYFASAGIPRDKQFKIASDDQRTVIVNRTLTTVAATSGLGFAWADDTTAPNTYGTKYQVANSISELPDSSAKEVHMIIVGPPSTSPSLLRDGWHIVGTHHADADVPNAAGLTVKIYVENGSVVTNDGSKNISINSAGFGYYDKMTVQLDGFPATSISINTGLQLGRVYRVKQTEASNDDYYMMPLSTRMSSETGDASAKSPYYYLEVPSPDSQRGLEAYSLPHELIETGTNAFTFKRIDYSERWAGDDVNNPDPSFTGNRIENVFFTNNRLGFLSQDNVILSRPINYGPEGTSGGVIVPDDNPYVRRNYKEIDFYHQSGIQQVADDPIDLNAASNDVSVFQTAISTPQGVVLFSDGNQSLMYSEQGFLTPATASIRAIAAYDKAPGIDAVIMGSKYYFINKTAKYCRLYEMLNQGMQNPPIVSDLTKPVSDWIPNDISELTFSTTTSTLLAYSRNSDILYVHKLLEEGMGSWVKWQLPGPIQNIFVDHDVVFISILINNKLYFGKGTFFVKPSDSLQTFPTIANGAVTPYIDFFTTNVTASGSSITPPSGFPNISGLTPVVGISGTDTEPFDDGNGSVWDCTWSGSKLIAPVDVSFANGRLTIGYRYNFELTLPTFYLQQQPNGSAPDYTAYTTISRIKFALGMSGDATFLTRDANSLTPEWNQLYSNLKAGTYRADTTPVELRQTVAEVPIHQRNTNFEIKITSNTHLPLSIDSCMWEGIYSPRYYKRA